MPARRYGWIIHFDVAFVAFVAFDAFEAFEACACLDEAYKLGGLG